MKFLTNTFFKSIYDCTMTEGEPRPIDPEAQARNLRYRAQMLDYIELNGLPTVMAVMDTTRRVLIGLQPMQPPNIQRIMLTAQELNFETERGQKADGREVNVFTGAYLADREAWDASLNDWRTRSEDE